ncbi:MAG: hypothetical protein NWQ38_14900 [Cellulophaga sp.]|nr:hypothetical protein [Cellulophaga sp.]
MKQQSIYKIVLCLFLMFTYGNAQKQIKTFTESYKVLDDAIININTTHTDIEFETWDKNEVAIEVIIEIEGADAQQMEAYFKQNEIKILGNSKQIDITTGVENTWFFKHATGGFNNTSNLQNLSFPELSTTVTQLENLSFMLDSIRFPDFSTLVIPDFDYEAFEKDGEAYLKKWKKNFETKFPKKEQEALNKMALAFEVQRKFMDKARQDTLNAKAIAYELRRNSLLEKRNKAYDENRKAYEERRSKLVEARAEKMEERNEAYEKRRKDVEERRAILRKTTDTLNDIKYFLTTDSLYFNTTPLKKLSPNVYYFNTDKKGNSVKVEVKKYLKIKMPKSVILKMNVRHGEVKLAESTKNMNGTFAYAGLSATTIEGDKTQISASYSPIKIQNWNYGKLKVNYADKVAINQVGNLTLSAVSSDITIGKLLNKIFSENSFGVLTINDVSDTFTAIDVSIKNGDLVCKTPKTPFTVTVNGESSEIVYPSTLNIEKIKNFNSILYKGFNKSKNTNKNISINAKFSEVVLD